jgi:hypothetical protein
VVALSAPVETLPLMPRVPLQPAVAMHETALVVLQLSVEALPVATVVGLAVNVTVGAGNTVTGAVADAGVVPAAPAQVKV